MTYFDFKYNDMNSTCLVSIISNGRNVAEYKVTKHNGIPSLQLYGYTMYNRPQYMVDIPELKKFTDDEMNALIVSEFNIYIKTAKGGGKKLKTNKVHTGPRGGKYIITKGKKSYV